MCVCVFNYKMSDMLKIKFTARLILLILVQTLSPNLSLSPSPSLACLTFAKCALIGRGNNTDLPGNNDTHNKRLSPSAVSFHGQSWRHCAQTKCQAEIKLACTCGGRVGRGGRRVWSQFISHLTNKLKMFKAPLAAAAPAPAPRAAQERRLKIIAAFSAQPRNENCCSLCGASI